MKHIFRLAILLVALSLCAQVQLTSSVTISGTSATVALPSSDAPLWVQFTAPGTGSAAANSNDVRCGDSNTSSTRGMQLPPGSGQMLPPLPYGIRYNSLSTIFCYVATGDKLVVSWAK